MKSRLFHILLIYLSLLVIYCLCRVVFVFYNQTELNIENNTQITDIFIHGLRFDFSAILFSNILCTLLLLSLFFVESGEWIKKVVKFMFIFTNGFFILLNCVDIVYYPYVQKRMQSDAFLFLNGEKGYETFGLIPHLLLQYWYILIFSGVLIYVMIRIYKYSEDKMLNRRMAKSFGFYSIFGLVFILFLNVVGMRGGFQLRPIDTINATESAGVENTSAVLNSTFSLILTWQRNKLNYQNFFPDSSLDNCEKGIHKYLPGSEKPKEKMNVVIIIVESLSKQYLSYFKGTSNTPFLDSLMNESLVFTNGFANARESVQGIPAILASIPSWMDEPFIFSRYSGNKINSIPSLLKNDRYTSAFFHGAARGTMGFYSFCKTAGFDYYYAKEDYDNEEDDFDGYWGIWDHKYLPYMGAKLSLLPEPFFASVLTIHSHHPFKMPDQFKNQFKKKGHPILSSIRYTDYALSLFFESVKDKSWYANTLFVITADHIGPNTDVLKNRIDDYRIPIIFYRPDGSLKGVSEDIANQIDILPTVMNYVGTEKDFFSPGRDLFSDRCNKISVNYKMGIYQYVDNTYFLQFDGTKTIGLYDWHKDKILKNNLVRDIKFKEAIHQIEISIKKKIQVFNRSMIDDQMKIQARGEI